MHTLDAVSRFLADPAVLAALGAATAGVLVAARRDYFWRLRVWAELRRSARCERRRADNPLGTRR